MNFLILYVILCAMSRLNIYLKIMLNSKICSMLKI